MHLCLSEMHVKAMHGYVYNYEICEHGTKSVTLKYFVVKNFSSNTPRDENILT